MIQKCFLCKVNILIPREINPAGEQGLSKTETQANTGDTFSFSANCSPLLLGISNGLKKKLEDTNCYILRTILNYSRAVSYDFLLNKAELQNLDNRRKFQSLVLLFKCLNGQGPQYLSEFFKVLNVNYNLRGSGTRLVLPHFNLECKHKSWSYLSTMLWNGLPAGVRGSPTLAVFRRALHSCLT